MQGMLGAAKNFFGGVAVAAGMPEADPMLGRTFQVRACACCFCPLSFPSVSYSRLAGGPWFESIAGPAPPGARL